MEKNKDINDFIHMLQNVDDQLIQWEEELKIKVFLLGEYSRTLYKHFQQIFSEKMDVYYIDNTFQVDKFCHPSDIILIVAPLYNREDCNALKNISFKIGKQSFVNFICPISSACIEAVQEFIQKMQQGVFMYSIIEPIEKKKDMDSMMSVKLQQWVWEVLNIYEDSIHSVMQIENGLKEFQSFLYGGKIFEFHTVKAVGESCKKDIMEKIREMFLGHASLRASKSMIVSLYGSEQMSTKEVREIQGTIEKEVGTDIEILFHSIEYAQEDPYYSIYLLASPLQRKKKNEAAHFERNTFDISDTLAMARACIELLIEKQLVTETELMEKLPPNGRKYSKTS